MKDMISNYPFSQRDLLENPEKYQKSSFHGQDFLYQYKKNRLKFIDNSKESNFTFSHFIDNIHKKSNLNNDEIILEYYLESLILEFLDLNQVSKQLDLLIKKFEITKKLFTKYDKNFKNSSSDYHYLKNYILLSTLCLLYYEQYHSLKHLNTSIKINDILCSKFNFILESEKPLFLFQLIKELKFVERLCASKNIQL